MHKLKAYLKNLIYALCTWLPPIGWDLSVVNAVGRTFVENAWFFAIFRNFKTNISRKRSLGPPFIFIPIDSPKTPLSNGTSAIPGKNLLTPQMAKPQKTVFL